MTVSDDTKSLTGSRIAAHLADAWPGTTLHAEPVPLVGGFWASMYRLRLDGQPATVPSDVVFRIAPDAAMGAKELAVQRTVAELGFATPTVRLAGPTDDALGGSWSVMDFARGTPPLGDLNGMAALRRAPALFARMPKQLAAAMASLHALDPRRVSAAVGVAAPTVVWRVEQLLAHFETAAELLDRPDLIAAVQVLAKNRPREDTTVICHGDLHPFNLLVGEAGDVTVIDWTAAILAAPAYDVAYTSFLLGNPPLDAPGPLGAVIHWVGGRLSRRFVNRYRTLAPRHDLGAFDWYRALHGARFLIEVASLEAQHGPDAGGSPLGALVPAAAKALHAVTGTPIMTPS